MIVQVFVFAFIFLIFAAGMAVVAFHVNRFRYSNDASLFVFSTLMVLFILTGLLTFTLFNYQPGTTRNNAPSTSNTKLL